MDEITVAEQLYSGSRDDFLPARTALAKQARAAGERELAVRIAALRKPTVGAWLVNQLVRRYPEQVVELERLAERMRVAHQRGDGDAIRAAGRDRQALLRTLAASVQEIARSADVKLGGGIADQVTTTFQAALVDPAALRAIQSGRLAATVEQDADLIGQLPDVAAPPPMWSLRTPERTPPKPKPRQAEPEPEPVVVAPPEPPPPSPELVAATQREAQTAAARERAEQALAAAQEHAQRTREQADAARAKFQRARQEHEAALETVATARETLTAAEREARSAHHAVVALRDQ